MNKESPISQTEENLTEAFEDVSLDAKGELTESGGEKTEGLLSEKTDSVSSESDEQTVENVEPLPDLQELYESPSIENPEATFDLDSTLKGIEQNLESYDLRIKQLEQKIEDAEKMGGIKAELGLTDNDKVENSQLNEEMKELDELKNLREQASELKEEVEALAELQEVMDQMVELNKQNKEAIKYLMNNGTSPDGKPLKTKNGKEISPDVAKDLAKSVESGVTKLTKMVVKTVLAVVKGVVKGVFQGVKAAVQN